MKVQQLSRPKWPKAASSIWGSRAHNWPCSLQWLPFVGFLVNWLIKVFFPFIVVLRKTSRKTWSRNNCFLSPLSATAWEQKAHLNRVIVSFVVLTTREEPRVKHNKKAINPPSSHRFTQIELETREEEEIKIKLNVYTRRSKSECLERAQRRIVRQSFDKFLLSLLIPMQHKMLWQPRASAQRRL